MNIEKFNSLIRNPNQLVSEDTGELVDLIKDYPYFQTAHLLLLYNLKAAGQEEFDTQLLSSALILADRSKVFNMVNAATMIRKSSKIEDPSPKNSDFTDAAVKDSIFQTTPIDHTDFVLEDNKPVENMDVAHYEENEVRSVTKTDLLDLDENHEKQNYPDETPREITFETKNEPTPEKIDLIGKFLEDIPVFTPTRIVAGEPEKDIAGESIREDEECVTETLAAIYMNQQLFESAISVYEKLILKYPEKSTYFGSRIEEIKKLIK